MHRPLQIDQAWILRLDNLFTDTAVRDLAEKAYSYQRFFKIYNYMINYMDLEISGEQAKCRMENSVSIFIFAAFTRFNHHRRGL